MPQINNPNYTPAICRTTNVASGAPSDTVAGLGGLVIGFDPIPTGFDVFIENSPAGIWSGIDCFTSGSNQQPILGLNLGDSLVVEFGGTAVSAGDVEVESPNNSFSAPNLILRKVSVGHPLPAFINGTTTNFKEIPSNAFAEQYKCQLVSINGPLTVVRTSLQASGIGTPNSFLCISPSAPADSVFIEGNKLATLPPPVVGSVVDHVQGILYKAARGFRILLRGSNDIVDHTPPNAIDAYPIADNQIRVVFDRGVTTASATNTSNYSLASFGSVDGAVMDGTSAVVLTITNGENHGDGETVTVNGIVGQANGLAMNTPQSLSFVNGVLSCAELQAPDPDSLAASPCVDKSRFAGPGAALGPRMSIHGVMTSAVEGVFDFMDSATGPRGGVVATVAGAFQAGHQYLLVGNAQESAGETQFVNGVLSTDQGVGSVPSASVESVEVARSVTCDVAQSVNTGEDFEGTLIQVANVVIVDSLAAGNGFHVANPANLAAGSLLITNGSNGGSQFYPQIGQNLSITGVLRQNAGGFYLTWNSLLNIVFPTINDTVTCQSETWTQVTIPGPAARYDHAMASDLSRGIVVLFGGRDGSSTDLSDTWEWDGSGWAQANPSTHPSARSGHSMAYDSKRDRILLFGGVGSSGYLGDTWAYNQATTSWTLLSSGGPTPRMNQAMAYDSERDRLVLYGGNNGSVLNDTWEWDGSAWIAQSVANPGPTQDACMVYDAGRGQMCLYGGDAGGSAFSTVWEWDGVEWDKVDSSGTVQRTRGAAAYGDACGGTLLFGGSGDGTDNTTRFWNGEMWSSINSGPGFRIDQAMAFDAATNRLLMFGGRTAIGQHPLGDTWTFCCGCGDGEAGTDSLGNFLPPLNLDPTAPISVDDVDQLDGDVDALYPQFDTSTDTWFPNDPCDPDIGGTILPEDSLNTTLSDLEAFGINGVHTASEISDSLGAWADAINTLFADVDSDLANAGPAMADYTPPPVPYVPPAGKCYVFGGRDLVFIHGLRLGPIEDKLLKTDLRAYLAWKTPTQFPGSHDNPEYYGSGYFAAGAERYWRKHIERYLQAKGIMNRYLIVAWPSTQRMTHGVQAVITQIGDAMVYGTGVVDPSGNNNTAKFGTPSYVVVSHSTGGLITDAIMRSAQKYPNLHADYVWRLCKGQVSIQSAFNGSHEATAMVALDLYLQNQFPGAVEPSWLCPLVNKVLGLISGQEASCPLGVLGIMSNSVLVDLTPPVTQFRWGPYMNTTPVPTVLLSGGHPSYMDPLKYILLHGFDDGVLSSNSQTANPNLWLFGAASYRATKLREVKDMGLTKKRARGYLLDQILDTAPFSLITRRVSAGAIPWISPSGMRQPVRRRYSSDSGLDPLQRYGDHTHFSFLQSASDHFANTPSSDADFNGNLYRDTHNLFGGGSAETNSEETRVITDPAIYSPTVNTVYTDTQPLLTQADAPRLEHRTRGKTVSFGTISKGKKHKQKKWLWKREYFLVKGWQDNMACDYMYGSILKRPNPVACSPVTPPATALQVGPADWLHDAFPFNETPGLPGTAAFDTAAALIKTGRNIAQTTGTASRFDIAGDSLVACACDTSLRMDLVFRVVPGPGNYKIAATRQFPPTPAMQLLRVPSNQSQVVAAGDQSFWGQYIASPGQFSAGNHFGGTRWDPNTWNSARMDTAELNIFPVSALGNLPQLSACSWSATYHEADPKYAVLGIDKFRCFVVDTTQPATNLNVQCDGTVPAWLNTVPHSQTGWDGNPATKEYTKILPDGLLTPGANVEYFIRRSHTSQPTATAIVPDTTLVRLQPGEGSLDCDGNVIGAGSDDGHRWQQFSILPDMWKAPQFGGPGMACMLYVDLDDGHGDERAWTTVADLIGATASAKYGAHNGWHAVSISADPNDPAHFVSVHRGQPGTTWDKYDIRGVDDAINGHAGALGGRLANRSGMGLATNKFARLGPTPEMLSTFYRLVYILSGRSNDRLLGPLADRSQDDVALLEGYLAGSAPGAPRGLFIEGQSFVSSEAQIGTPAHLGLLSNYLGLTLQDADYSQLSTNATACVDLNTTSIVTLTPSWFAVNASDGGTENVLRPNPAISEAAAASFYSNFGANGPYAASVLKAYTAVRPWIALTDGWDIKHLESRYCETETGRPAYLYSVLTNVFGAVCATSVGPGAGAGVVAEDVPRESYVRLLNNAGRSGTTQVELGMARRDFVTVRLYDIAGRSVREVTHQAYEPGVYRVPVVGSGQAGERLRSGMYFIRVDYGLERQTHTRKVVLIR